MEGLPTNGRAKRPAWDREEWEKRSLHEPPSLLDASVYSDPELYQKELDKVFFRSWIPVCPITDVPQRRDFVVWEEIGQSVVIARRDDGALSAWHNVCQHRGARVVRESGHCHSGTFICPWHGFGYDLAGCATNVPIRNTFDEKELEGLRIPEVGVRELWGFIWICLQPQNSLEEYLGPLLDELGWYGLDRFETRYRKQWRMRANWKTVVDAFNETWHVPMTHRDTLSHIVLWREAHLRDLTPHSMMTIPIKLKRPAPEGEDPRASMIGHFLAFPNTIYSCFPTHLQMWSVWPVNVRESVMNTWGIVGPTPPGMTDDEWALRNDRDWEHFVEVARQDAEVLDDAGHVHGSLGYRRNMFNVPEGRLTIFHRTLEEIISGGRWPTSVPDPAARLP
jgi:choline monooxygenase